MRRQYRYKFVGTAKCVVDLTVRRWRFEKNIDSYYD
jgi:hypothetical protein